MAYCLMLIACLVAKSIQYQFFAIADALWSWIKAKVIKTSMNIYGIPTSTIMPSLNIIINSLTIVWHVAS